jgi:hypothetical protein
VVRGSSHAGDCGPADPGPTDPGPANPGPAGPGPAGGAPSNAFSVRGSSASAADGTVTVSVDLPGPGRLAGVATASVQVARKKKVTVARKSLTAAKAGRVRLKLSPTRKAKGILKKKGRLKASLKLTFTPTGGSPKSSTRSVTFKLKKKRKKR